MTAAEDPAVILNRVIAAARAVQRNLILKGTIAKDDLVVASSAPNLDLPAEFLPLSDIEQDLVELGLSEESVRVLSSSISSLNDVYKRSVQRFSARLDLPGLPTTREIIDKLTKYFRETYRKELLPILKERILVLLHARDESRFAEVDATEPSFNTQYTPFLLQYFEFNAYPSLADRQLLAKKSGMTPRQIEVWFQNRRRRLRSTGRNCFPRRGACDALPEQSEMYGFVDEMSAFKSLAPLPVPPIAVDRERYASVISPKHKRNQYAKDVFHRLAPAHAFPRKISEKGLHPDPFPRKGEDGPRFPSPSWYRKPALQRPKHQQVDLDDLLKQFNLLRAGDYKMSKDEEEKHIIPGAPPAATFAFTVVPESAPLKARAPQGVCLPPGIPLPRREESPIPEQPKKKTRLPRRTPSSKPARSHPYPRTPSLSPTSSRTSSATLSSGSSSRSSSPGPHTPPPITALALPGLEDSFMFARSSSPGAVSSGFDYLFGDGDEPSPDLPQQDLSFESLLDGITFPTLPLPPIESSLTLPEQESSSTELDHFLNSWTNDSLLNQPIEQSQTSSDSLLDVSGPLDFDFDLFSTDWNVDFTAFPPDTQTQPNLNIPEFTEADLQALTNAIEPAIPTISPSSLVFPTPLPPLDVSVPPVFNTFDVSTPPKSTTYTDLTGRKQMLFDLLGNVTVPFGFRVGF